jgi:hypothetical protein
MSLKKNPSQGTGMWRIVPIGHYWLRSQTLDHIKRGAQDMISGATMGITENKRVEVPIIPKGLSSIETTGTISTLPPQLPPPTKPSVYPPLVDDSGPSTLLTVRPGPTIVDPSLDPP